MLWIWEYPKLEYDAELRKKAMDYEMEKEFKSNFDTKSPNYIDSETQARRARDRILFSANFE